MKLGLADPCYKCGAQTKHKTIWHEDEQVMVCGDCDPEEQGTIAGTCTNCKEKVPKSESGWDGADVLTHYPKGKKCGGEIEEGDA